MIGKIDQIIGELATIQNALWSVSSDPRERARLSGAPVASSRVSGSLYVEDGPLEPTDPARWKETVEGARRRIGGAAGSGDSTGVEALAWYRSFHCDQSRWGIYIPTSSLAVLDELYLSKLDMPRADRHQFAAEALLAHERFHFAVDLAIAWFEILLRLPVRAESARRMSARTGLHGITATQNWLEVEETGANAHMLRTLARTHSPVAFDALAEFVREQPAGYRDGLIAVGDQEFKEAMAETIRSHVGVWAMERGLDLGSPALDPTSVIPILNEAAMNECPVFYLDDLEDSGLGAGHINFILCIEAVQETDHFKKKLRKLDKRFQTDWEELKKQIRVSLPKPPRFKKFRSGNPPFYSLYLQAGHRVHLYPPTNSGEPWQAFEVGTHTEMGHD